MISKKVEYLVPLATITETQNLVLFHLGFVTFSEMSICFSQQKDQHTTEFHTKKGIKVWNDIKWVN